MNDKQDLRCCSAPSARTRSDSRKSSTRAIASTGNVRVLVIGCGRIGAGVGADEIGVGCHAGAIKEMRRADITFFDEQPKLARRASRRLGASSLEHLPPDLRSYHIVAVCTPTPNHVHYLDLLVDAGVQLVLCEKPICNDLPGLRRAKRLYANGSTRILVNYTRRFLPAFIELRSQMRRIKCHESVRACLVRYQRGFLNNASHALDLLQYLLEWEITDARVAVSAAAPDEFADDPTISLAGNWNGAELVVTGLTGVKFSLFEIDLFFERSAVRIRDQGDVIQVAIAGSAGAYYAPLATVHTRSGCLDGLFCHVYGRAFTMLTDRSTEDNFLSAAALTEWMLKIKMRLWRRS